MIGYAKTPTPPYVKAAALMAAGGEITNNDGDYHIDDQGYHVTSADGFEAPRAYIAGTSSEDHLRVYANQVTLRSEIQSLNGFALTLRSQQNQHLYLNAGGQIMINDAVGTDLHLPSNTIGIYNSPSGFWNIRSDGDAAGTRGGFQFQQPSISVGDISDLPFGAPAVELKRTTSRSESGMLMHLDHGDKDFWWGATAQWWAVWGDDQAEKMSVQQDGTLTCNNLDVTGSKNFVIPHPHKDHYLLRHSVLEGPERGVYQRGELEGDNVIDLPDYWKGLVEGEDLTVHLQPEGSWQELWIESKSADRIVVGTNNGGPDDIHCSYLVIDKRVDMDPLVVEEEDTRPERLGRAMREHHQTGKMRRT